MKVDLLTLDSRGAPLANPKLWIFAYCRNDESVIGMCSLEENGVWPWLNNLYVHPSFRRQHVGLKLVNESVRIVRDEKTFGTQVQGVAAGVRWNNEGSMMLLQEAGFRNVYSFPDNGSLLYTYGFHA